MAIALAQDNVAAGVRDNSSSSTLTVTFTKTTTAGHHLILSAFQSSAQVLSSISDSRGNTWQVDVAFNGSNTPTDNVASCHITTGHQIGDTLTLTFAGAGSFSAAIVSEWSGLASTSWFDKSHTATAASGTPSSGATLTRSSANELLYGALVNLGNGATAGTGYTLLTTTGTVATGVRNLVPEYQIVSSTGTDAATWTYSGAYNAVIATYVASAGSPPSNTVAPAVTGTAQVGSVLTTDNGTWSNTPTSYAYQWQRDNAGGGTYGNISSATSSTYTLVDADDACQVRCVVTATNASGSASANSNASSITEPTATNSVAPVASGTAQVNVTVSATTGTWANMGGTIATFAYQWQDSADGSTGWANVSGATSSSYTIASGEAAKYLRCNVTATNTGGTSSATSSNVLGPVTSAATSGSASGGVNFPTSLLVNQSI